MISQFRWLCTFLCLNVYDNLHLFVLIIQRELNIVNNFSILFINILCSSIFHFTKQKFRNPERYHRLPNTWYNLVDRHISKLWNDRFNNVSQNLWIRQNTFCIIITHCLSPFHLIQRLSQIRACFSVNHNPFSFLHKREFHNKNSPMLFSYSIIGIFG